MRSGANKGEVALARRTERAFPVVLLELSVPRSRGPETRNGVREADSRYEVVRLAGRTDDRATNVDSGALDSYPKPPAAARIDEPRQTPSNRCQSPWETALPQDILRSPGVPAFVGDSPAIQALLATIQQVAPSDARVVILGESGTGKGLLARRIHAFSRRRAKPFVDVHCGAVADQLLESELFGHERGAFTGAVADKPGLFELADGGSLFLDEFAEMTPEMQVKLLKVLDYGELRRVGGIRTTTVDVRVLMATNRNLDELARAGRVREDLLYRIDVIRVTVPPLRHRPEDVPRFVSYFITRHLERGLGTKTFTPEALQMLQRYPWPGNVRELSNTVERLMVLLPGPTIDVGDLPETVRAGRTVFQLPIDDLSLTLEEVERRHVLRVLESVKRNRAAAARRLGLNRATLKRKLKRWEHDTLSGLRARAR